MAKTNTTKQDDKPVITFVTRGKVLFSNYTKKNEDGTLGETVLSAKLLSPHAIDAVRDAIGEQNFPVYIHSAWLAGKYENHGAVYKAPVDKNVWNCAIILSEKLERKPVVLCVPISLENIDNTIKNREHEQIMQALKEG